MCPAAGSGPQSPRTMTFFIPSSPIFRPGLFLHPMTAFDPSMSRAHTIRVSKAPVRMTATESTANPFTPGVMTLQNEGAYAVMAAATAIEAETGKRVIHLEIGQPGYPTPDHICDAGVTAIRSGSTKYSSPAGIASLRDTIADWANKNRGLNVGRENVVVGPGAKPGLFFTTLALVGRGEQVVIPDPGFPTYRAMVEVAGGVVVPVRLDKGMRGFDMEEFERKVGERTKMVVLNSPGNPTGGVMDVADLRRIAELAKKFDFWVVSDEIYSQLVYSGNYTSIGSMEGMEERTVIVDGFSKSYCMTGWRLGWAIMPATLAERVELLLVHSVGCTATFTQAAGVAALMGPDDGVREMREEYRRRRDIVVEGLNEIEGVRCETPEGAFYAFADVKQLGTSSREIADMLLREGLVAVLPGTDFGEGGEGYIRLSYVAEEENLREGLRRIKETLGKLRR